MEKKYNSLGKICEKYHKKSVGMNNSLKTPKEKVMEYIEFPKISYKELERRSVRPHFL